MLWLCQDNGGLNDRHWIFDRSLLRVVLGAWVARQPDPYWRAKDHILDGYVTTMHQAAPGLPWWGAETFFGLRLMWPGHQVKLRDG